jgi:hypothetical protein
MLDYDDNDYGYKPDHNKVPEPSTGRLDNHNAVNPSLLKPPAKQPALAIEYI